MSGASTAMRKRRAGSGELGAVLNAALLILLMGAEAQTQQQLAPQEHAGQQKPAAKPLTLVSGGSNSSLGVEWHHGEEVKDQRRSTTPVAAALEDEDASWTSTTEPAMRLTQPPLKRPSFLEHVHLHPPDGQRRYGPYFEDGLGPFNVTARVGSTVLLDCRIGMLQDKTVTWIQRKEDSIHLLTVGKQAYSNDARFSLNFRYPNNWRLQILFVSRRDEATYECQVATHPPRVLQVRLRVSAPELHILDEHGHAVWDRYYKVGSRVELLCEASRVQESPSTVEWRQAGVSLAAVAKNHSRPDLSVTSGTLVGKDTVRTVLTLQRARKQDSGNYTCVVADIAEATVTVHILNGELPAAVQHGTSGQAPVTPLLGVLVILSHLVVTCQSR
ncbi:uncharacterized protein LOC135947785 [Cloeon dipterum]|uniref:uncharacterized protein LOC135947785 n=1 Tax=Cloeon dipterum TaxID=197152 RepID=UPI00322051B2